MGVCLVGIQSRCFILRVVIIYQMNDLEEGLIAGRGKKEANNARKRFEECELKVKTLRNKNNELQKQCDNQLMEGDIRSAIRAQTGFIENQISEIRKALEKLSKDFTDPASKNKIKEICAVAGKEMERNKRIMQEFMNRASASPSVYRRDSTNPYNKSRSEMDKDLFAKHKKEDNFSPVRESNSIIASEDMINDLRAEQKMLSERNALLKELEEKNNKINQIMNEMGAMVGGEQKDLINAMEDNLIAVKQNAQDANTQMDQAIVQQKKGKKKYMCLIIVIVIILLAALGILYFLVF